MALTWRCESPEPGRRGSAAPWAAEIGPVRLEVAEDADRAWCASLHYPIGGQRGHVEGRTWPTLGEAMEGAERWARLKLEDWRDLGELGRVALLAWGGENGGKRG